MIPKESVIFTKHSLKILATSLSSVTSTSFSKRVVLEEACILSEKSGLTVFQNFQLSVKHLISKVL